MVQTEWSLQRACSLQSAPYCSASTTWRLNFMLRILSCLGHLHRLPFPVGVLSFSSSLASFLNNLCPSFQKCTAIHSLGSPHPDAENSRDQVFSDHVNTSSLCHRIPMFSSFSICISGFCSGRRRTVLNFLTKDSGGVAKNRERRITRKKTCPALSSRGRGYEVSFWKWLCSGFGTSKRLEIQ